MRKLFEWDSIKSFVFPKWLAAKSLLVWLFASFVFPLVQLLIFKFSSKSTSMDENSFVIVFVAIASFLTSFFFVSSFWKHNRNIARMMLIASYIISLVLFVSCRFQTIFNVVFFDNDIYKWGMYVSLFLAIIVGYITKLDEQQPATRIANQAKNLKKGSFDGKNFEL